METKTIVRVNNVDIIATSDEQLIAIRPICEALGIDYSRQLKKIKEDPDLGPTVGMKPTVAADGKQREMLCMPVEFIFGWLFTINPDNVNEDAREAVRRYRMECYRTLYRHFTGTQKRQLEQNRQEIELLERLADYNQQKEAITKGIADTKRKLEQLRNERLKNEPQLFD